MERAISEMERIRRAEEIYSRRRNSNIVEENKLKPKSIYKNLFQFLVLLNIAVAIVAFQNKEYIFTNEFIEQVNGYNINLKEKFEGMLSSDREEKDGKPAESQETEELNPEVQNQEAQETAEPTSAVETEQACLVENDAPVELSQMELDAIEIKKNFSIMLPISGTKTSGFGHRESSNSIVTGNHTGVDIAAVKGTVIKAAMSGTVTQVSNQGSYGKHFRITCGNVTTLYAHCSKIYVSEGQEITQGQDIAEVGSTGNSTGPHLHLEFIYEDRFVDPELVLEI